MKPKILFWIDRSITHFGLAKYIQDNLDCELFSIFEVTNKPKIFFQEQKIVKFKKIWFYHDFILKTKRKANLNFLKSIEEKYNIPLWIIAANDRIFNHYNKFYEFSENEILLILEDEIKLFETILDEIKPEFIILAHTHQQHNHIFYEICKAKNIKILMMFGTRTSMINTPTSWRGSFYLTDEMDKFLPLPKTAKPNIYKNVLEKLEKTVDKNEEEKFTTKTENSISAYLKACMKYLFTNDTNTVTHYSYFGRNKIKVIFRMISYELRKKYREGFMEKNLQKNIETDSPFVYFPLHQEEERALLIGTPFFTNQFEVIKNIAQSLPIGYKLYVKDHTVMDVRGWRSVSEMKKIMNLYNVVLLHPLVISDDVIKNSDLVITLKGTPAIDAAMQNKPSICFENTGLYKLDSIHKLSSLQELPEAIRMSLGKKVDAAQVQKYLDIISEQTFEFETREIEAYYQNMFNMGGYYVNIEIEPEKMRQFLEKFKPEFTRLAIIHVEKIKQLVNK